MKNSPLRSHQRSVKIQQQLGSQSPQQASSTVLMILDLLLNSDPRTKALGQLGCATAMMIGETVS
jgi:hypothetical protein